MSDFSPPNGSPAPTGEQLAAIISLANALGSGSAKLCEALLEFMGPQDGRYARANRIDAQLQPLMRELAGNPLLLL